MVHCLQIQNSKCTYCKKNNFFFYNKHKSNVWYFKIKELIYPVKIVIKDRQMVGVQQLTFNRLDTK